ncbi:MAG: A/G-specific adenine glycosylase [Saprospiraceae bacterium]|nr:A/G-specific adenine glycosylase [Saprospiraceae bacterium]
MQDNHYFFVKNLLQWHLGHHRPMPWKGERNPYLIWLSEIILQQTRVEQGLPYFERFKAAYPTVVDLANAPEDEVMKLWEGLGYYSRARNLHGTAKHISTALNGSFPSDYEGIRSLKGVGDYTAAAIASFAYDLPYVVVDGNVYRVLSRFFGIETPIDTTEGKKQFAKLAQQLLDLCVSEEFKIAEGKQVNSTPSGFNQAIMDFGATHCTPASPKCASCPMQPHCEAQKQGNIGLLPIKSKKLERRNRFFNYLIINHLDKVFIKKREEKDIWQNLYDFPLIETESLQEERSFLSKNKTVQTWLGESDWGIKSVSPPMRQELTHQRIVATFWEIEMEDNFLQKVANWTPIERKNLTTFAFPKVIDLYIRKKSLPLELF